MKPDLYMHNFSIIHRYSVMHHIKDMKESPVAGHTMGYIVYIHKNPGASQEDIVDFFKLNKGTVAKGIKKLLEEGYVSRKQNEADRRAYQLYLTEKGIELHARSEQSLNEFNDILTKGLTEAEQQTLQYLLGRVTGNVLEAAGEAKDDLMRPGPPPECKLGPPPGLDMNHAPESGCCNKNVKKGD